MSFLCMCLVRKARLKKLKEQPEMAVRSALHTHQNLTSQTFAIRAQQCLPSTRHCRARAHTHTHTHTQTRTHTHTHTCRAHYSHKAALRTSIEGCTQTEHRPTYHNHQFSANTAHALHTHTYAHLHTHTHITHNNVSEHGHRNTHHDHDSSLY